MVCPPADLFLDGTDWLPHLLDFFCCPFDGQPTPQPLQKKIHMHTYTQTLKIYVHFMCLTSDGGQLTEQTEWGGMGLGGLLFIWGRHRFVSPTKLISANCNPHQYVLFIIGELETDVFYLWLEMCITCMGHVFTGKSIMFKSIVSL